MSMSTYVKGFMPGTEQHEKMSAVWHACVDAGIAPPPEVEHYFEDGPPDRRGMQVTIASHSWSGDMQDGIEVVLAELDPAVTVIRFINSY